MPSTKLTREQIPPGTWIWITEEHYNNKIRNKAFQISEVEPYGGLKGVNLSIAGAPEPNKDGGYNVDMKYCRLATPEEIPAEFRKSEVINSYQIY